jgi:hypothetical protein
MLKKSDLDEIESIILENNVNGKEMFALPQFQLCP